MNFALTKFVLSCYNPSQFPKNHIPEIAMIGRSNVGKSSIINSITKQKLLAKVSKTPGATQCINFFNIENKKMLVDLPGYGYAQVPLKVKENWEKLIISYIQHREQLDLCFLLLDAKVGIKESDINVMKLLLNNNRKIMLLLTKCDKKLGSSVDHIIGSMQTTLHQNNITNITSENFVVTSARKNYGIKDLQNIISNT